MVLEPVRTEKIVKTYSSFNQVLVADVNHGAANCLGRVEAKSVVLIPLPWIDNPLGVYSPLVNCPRHRNIDKFTALITSYISTLASISFDTTYSHNHDDPA